MKLSQLRKLVAVAEAGSVRQASRDLNVSQSAVTKSIKQLEEHLGVELFHRESHGVVPTAAGLAMVARAKVIESELRQARNDIEAVQGANSGEIRVSASPTVAMGLLPKAILSFKKTRPDVTFQIEEGLYPAVLPAIRMGELDLAICLVPERPTDDELHFELLVRDRLTPAVRDGHPLTEQRNLSFSDLLSYNWVIYRRNKTRRDIFEQTFISHDLEPPRNTIKCTSFACAMSLVESSDYVTLVPEKIFAGKSMLGNITPLRMGTSMPPWNVMVITRAEHVLSPLCMAFLKELRKVTP
jgi:DNA-binding transcriptional LysR family regulator